MCAEKKGLVKSHVKANHITGVSHSCDICGKTSRSRDNFRHHKKPSIIITHICRTRDGVIFHKQKHHKTTYTERKGLRKHKEKEHRKLRNVWNEYNLIKPDKTSLRRGEYPEAFNWTIRWLQVISTIITILLFVFWCLFPQIHWWHGAKRALVGRQRAPQLMTQLHHILPTAPVIFSHCKINIMNLNLCFEF